MEYKLVKVDIHPGELDYTFPRGYNVQGIVQSTPGYIIFMCSRHIPIEMPRDYTFTTTVPGTYSITGSMLELNQANSGRNY